jgi:uncharacterized protein
MNQGTLEHVKREEMEVTQEQLVRFLKNPSSYGHQPVRVVMVQTHSSMVAIAPPFVFKLKKHLDLGFLDFRTLAARKANCEREVQLNRRLCPEIYLGVVPVCLDNGTLRFGGKGTTVDYAVQMKQLADGYFLNQLVRGGQAAEAQLEQVLQVLKTFYEQQAEVPSRHHFADIPQLRRLTTDNLAALRLLPADIAAPEALQAIQEATQNFLTCHADLFRKRLSENRIREGHGDLHLDHIHLQEGRVCIFDCLEFSDQLRFLDVAADIAFLAMDLDFHGQPGLAAFVSSRFAQLTHDPDLLLLLDFYKCYRACVRAKVEVIRLEQPHVEEPERALIRHRLQRYLHLALQYATLGSGPVVLMVGGRIGSGKSTLARRMAELLGFPYLGSDPLRKKEAHLPLHHRTDAAKRKWLYSEEKTREIYQLLLHKSLRLVKRRKISVVVDSTFGKKDQRAAFTQALEAEGVFYLYVEASAADEVIKARLEAREKDPKVISDARLEDFETLSQAYEQVDEVPARHLIQTNTEGELSATLGTVFQKMTNLSFPADRTS